MAEATSQKCWQEREKMITVGASKLSHALELMKFGKQLLAESHPPWQAKYVDYKMLKDKIKYKKPQATEFEALIVRELDKVNKWCQFNSRRLSASTAALESGQDSSFTKEEIDEDIIVFRKYIILNTLAVVKIIKKFNRRVKRRLDSSTVLSLHFPFSERVAPSVEAEVEKKDNLEPLEGFLKSELAVAAGDEAAVPQIRCHSCHQPIYGEFVSFEGRLFHPEHVSIFSRWKQALVVLAVALLAYFLGYTASTSGYFHFS